MVQFTTTVFNINYSAGAEYGTVDCISYVDNNNWASNMYGVESANIWHAKTPYAAMNSITFASSETTIQELKCYNFDQDELTETTNDFNFSNAEDDVSMEGNNTIYLWLGSGTSITYSMALLITTNTNEKYLLVVEKPAQ